jgi:hypothetical protein
MSRCSRLSWLALFTLFSTAIAWGVAIDPVDSHGESNTRSLHRRSVKKTLRVTWEEGNPNGMKRDVIKVNGQFPSPNLVFDEGDDVEVRPVKFCD